MTLDPTTMLIIEAFVLFLVGGLTFMAAFQGGRDRTLLWAAVGMWMACLGFFLGAFRGHDAWQTPVIIVSNMLFITSHACLWTSLNIFRGKPVQWLYLGVGAFVWLLLCQWPVFFANANWRTAGYSALSLVYIGACLMAVRPAWHKSNPAALAIVLFLTLHGLFYLYRMVASPLQSAVWRTWPDFALVIFEGLFFAVSMSYGILMMVRAQAEQNYRYAALHDALTKLPNRRALFERGASMLEHARQDHADVAVLMCDLDWFKSVNDRFGHEAGDEVLVCFSQVLRECADKEHLPARLGGEEFTVLAMNLGPLSAQALATRIRMRLADQASRLPCRLTVSIGIACAQQIDYNLDRLLACADQALYAAKVSGRDCVRIWPVQVTQAALDASAAISRDGAGAAPQHPVDA
ncbi:GGDEF domain-containing protein [Castellaniella sp.]|uniref:GGDEF domain-containing protein n=1 Tax=Castellaniella sp. TaxID=1955812 RepID=UPI002AFE0184|nr:GGDEF domain-containing protein [Castellaniella sp.]